MDQRDRSMTVSVGLELTGKGEGAADIRCELVVFSEDDGIGTRRSFSFQGSSKFYIKLFI